MDTIPSISQEKLFGESIWNDSSNTVLTSEMKVKDDFGTRSEFASHACTPFRLLAILRGFNDPMTTLIKVVVLKFTHVRSGRVHEYMEKSLCEQNESISYDGLPVAKYVVVVELRSGNDATCKNKSIFRKSQIVCRMIGNEGVRKRLTKRQSNSI